MIVIQVSITISRNKRQKPYLSLIEWRRWRNAASRTKFKFEILSQISIVIVVYDSDLYISLQSKSCCIVFEGDFMFENLVSVVEQCFLGINTQMYLDFQIHCFGPSSKGVLTFFYLSTILVSKTLTKMIFANFRPFC